MAKKTRLENDYERMVPEFHKATLTYAEHLTRYMCAQPVVKGKVVLDIASGSGYGSQLLAQSAKKVYGVDIDAASVAYSQENYGAKNIEYKVGDGESIPLDDNSVDVVVTFETIEHIKDYKKFIKEVKRVLRGNGLAIVSTPNDPEFAEGNHFHLHEFEYDELHSLLKKDFANIDSYFQGTWKYVAIGERKLLESEGAIDLTTLNLSPKKPEQYLYFFMLCSNRRITEKVKPLAAVGEHYSDRQLVSKAAFHKEQEKGLENKIKYLEDNLAKANQQGLEMQLSRDALAAEIVEIKSSKMYRISQKINRKGERA